MEISLLTCGLAAIIGLIPAAIASSKGHSFLGWWIFGSLLFIVALPVAILVAPNEKPQPEIMAAIAFKKCPYCAESIKREAVVCRFCNRELPVGDSDSGSVTSQQLQSLTYHQRRVLTEYGYYVEVGQAEEIAMMLGNLANRRAIEDYVKKYGVPVAR